MKIILIGLLNLSSFLTFADCNLKYDFVQPHHANLSKEDYIAVVNKVLEKKGYHLSSEDNADLVVKIKFFESLESPFTKSIVSISDLGGHEMATAESSSQTIFGKNAVGLSKKAANETAKTMISISIPVSLNFFQKGRSGFFHTL